jgi:hypothetical protein
VMAKVCTVTTYECRLAWRCGRSWLLCLAGSLARRCRRRGRRLGLRRSGAWFGFDGWAWCSIAGYEMGRFYEATQFSLLGGQQDESCTCIHLDGEFGDSQLKMMRSGLWACGLRALTIRS